MKFDCGPSRAEKRKARAIIRAGKIKAKYERLRNWHPHFALFPVRIAKGDCRWLETVERRGTQQRGYWPGEDYWTWEYRAR